MERNTPEPKKTTPLQTAERTWNIVRRICKKGAMNIKDIAKYLHCTERNAANIMRAMQHFEPPIPIYRRTESGQNTLLYDVHIGKLFSQFEPERQSRNEEPR